MDRNFLLKELPVLRNKIFKALNIYEEENNIPSKKKTKREPIDVENPKPFSEFVERYTVKCIEGIVFSLNAEKVEEKLIVDDLSNIKLNLLSLMYTSGDDYYKELKKTLFNSMDIVTKIIDNIENRRY